MLREEATRKTKALSEDNKQLHKYVFSYRCKAISIISCVQPTTRELSAKKHEAQALMSEMEDTTQAFEEAREQNLRLVQELKVKCVCVCVVCVCVWCVCVWCVCVCVCVVCGVCVVCMCGVCVCVCVCVCVHSVFIFAGEERFKP